MKFVCTRPGCNKTDTQARQEGCPQGPCPMAPATTPSLTNDLAVLVVGGVVVFFAVPVVWVVVQGALIVWDQILGGRL